MSKYKILSILDKTIPFFLALLLLSQYNRWVVFLRSPCLYISIIFVIILFFYNKKQYIENFKNNFLYNKKIILSIFCFFIYLIIISFFSYSSSFESLYWLFHENRRAIPFFILILFWFDEDKKKSKIIFYALAFALIFSSVNYIIEAYARLNGNFLENFKNNKIIIDRTYSFIFDIVFIFGLVSLVIAKNKYLKLLFAIFVFFIGPILILLTGSRGSWLGVILVFIMSIILLAKKNYIKKNDYKIFSIVCAIFVVIFIGLALNSGLIKNKIFQTDSSGRDSILLTRLPLLYNSDRFFWGIGYGDINYWRFLHDKNIKNIDLGPHSKMLSFDNFINFKEEIKLASPNDRTNWENEKKYLIRWVHDEPFIINIFWHSGFIGSFLMFIYILIIFFGSIRRYFIYNNVYYIALTGSCLSYTIIRGLFESNFFLENVIYMGAFYILFFYRDKKCFKSA